MLIVLFLFILIMAIYWFYHPGGERETGSYLYYLKKAKASLRNKGIFKEERITYLDE